MISCKAVKAYPNPLGDQTMHVLIIPPERYLPKDAPLAGIFQHHQAQALKRAGHKVAVMAPPELRSIRFLGKPLSGWPTGICVEDDEGVPLFKYCGWHWLPRVPRAYIWLRLRAGISLFRAYATRHGMPEIIHAHNALFAGVLACRIKKESCIPYVLTEHSTAYARGLIRGSEMAYIKDAFQDADRRLVVSPALGGVLEEILGDSVRPWEWVPNILDSSFEKNVPAKEIEGGSGGSFRFLNVGSLTEKKGQADLLRAFANRFAPNSDVQLRIGGDGPLRSELEALTNDLGIDGKVIFLGGLDREQVLGEMQACDAFVLSSHYETFGVVIIEALACGKPVIAAACGGPECIVREDNGVLVPPGDIEKLGEAMAVMRRNVDKYDGPWIRQDCIARFGERAMVGQLLSIYTETIRNT